MTTSRRSILVFLSVFLLAALWLAGSASSQEPILIARWPMDESSGDVVHDVVGGNDGKFVGGKFEWVQAKFENGLLFEGVAGMNVEIPRNPELESPDSVTLMAWVKFNAIGGRHEIASYADSYFITMDGVFNAYIHHDVLRWPQAVGQTLVEPDKWYLAAMTYDGQDVKLYVDGQLDAVKPAAGTIGYLNLLFRFGSHASGGANWLNGILDEVEIWDRAMTAGEILAAYESPLASTAVSPKGALTATWGQLKLR